MFSEGSNRGVVRLRRGLEAHHLVDHGRGCRGGSAGRKRLVGGRPEQGNLPGSMLSSLLEGLRGSSPRLGRQLSALHGPKSGTYQRGGGISSCTGDFTILPPLTPH
jgi:hypothetical protein